MAEPWKQVWQEGAEPAEPLPAIDATKPWERQWNVANDVAPKMPWERQWATPALAQLEGADIGFTDKIGQPVTTESDAENMAKAQGAGLLDGAKNLAKGLGERVVQLEGGAVRSMATALPGSDPVSDFIYWATGRDKPENYPTPEEVTKTGQEAAKQMENVDLGFEEGDTWEDVKKAPASKFLPWALKQGLLSAPDMALAMASLPGYAAIRSGELAQDRAENDQRADATVDDMLKAAPAAVVSGLLDRIGGRAMFGLDEVAVQSLKQVPKEVAKAAIKEGVTEGAQEGIESVATTAGTQKGFDAAQTGEQMLAGALAGGVTGGAVRAGTGTVESAIPQNTPVEGDQSATVETGVPPAQAPVTQDGGEEQVSPLAVSPSSAASPTERAILRATAMPDEDIDQMSREEVVAKVAEAKAANISVSGDQIRAAARYESPAAIFSQSSTGTPTPVEALPEPAQAETQAATDERPVDRMRREYEARKANDAEMDQQAEQAFQSAAPALSAAVLQNTYAEGQKPGLTPPASVDTTPSALSAARRLFAQYQAKNDQVDKASSEVLPELEQAVSQSVSRDMQDEANVEKALGAPLKASVMRSMYEDAPRNNHQPAPGRMDMGAVNASLASDAAQRAMEKSIAAIGGKVNPAGLPLDKNGAIKKPDSLIEFLARRGGIREVTGELKSLGLTNRKTGFVVGAGPLVRPKGVHPDKAVEAAVQAGYLRDGATIDDLYEAMAQDARTGREVFAQPDMDWGAAWREQRDAEARGGEDAEAEARAYEDYRNSQPSPEERIRQDIYLRLIDDGYPGQLGSDFHQRVARFHMAGESYEDAIFYAYDEMLQDAASMAGMPAIPEIPFFGDENNEAFAGTTAQGRPGAETGGFPGDNTRGEIDAGGTVADREVRGEGGPEAEIGRGREDGERSDQEGESQRPQRVAEEPGADNKPQLVIPGAERATDADIAQRRADAPIKPKVAQKDAGGLFSDERDQKDLLDLATNDKPNSGNDKPNSVSAPAGWDMADTGEPAPFLSEAEQKRLAEIVMRTSGLNPEFVERINVPANAPGLMAWGKGGEEGSTAAGFYANMRDAITLALDTAPARAGKVAYHESFHRLQNLFINDKERNLLKANDAKLRKMIADRGEYSEDTVSRMSRKEVEAEAFGIWANGQDNAGFHIGIRKVWKNIRDMLTRVRNYLKGRGYQTVDDVFGKAKSGEIAKRGKVAGKVAGIPGHRFLDRWSRKDSDGTYNYVIYDDSRVDVLDSYSIAPAVDTPAFKRWFGDSKIVDAEGKPMKVYHGTHHEFESFKFGEKSLQAAFFFSPSPRYASTYAGSTEGSRVVPVYLSIQNPFEIGTGPLTRGRPDKSVKMDNSSFYVTKSRADELKSQGYDGIINYTAREILAFDPSQIKSVNNRGTFDPADDRILYSIVDRAPDQPIKPKSSAPTVKPRGRFSDRLGLASKALAAKIKSKGGRYDRLTEDDEENLADLTTRKVLDYLDPVLKMQEKAGGNLNDYADAYLTARLAEGTIRHELHVADEKYVQPAIKELAQVGATEEDLHRYMYAMHAPERNRVVGLRNDPDSDLYKAATDPSIRGASGMSTNEAKQTLAELAKDRDKFIGIRRAASHIRAMLDNGLKNQLRAGLINKATYERLTQQWQHYVPLRAEADQDGTVGGSMPKKSRGFDVRGDEFKGATGRYTKADNVVTYAINNAEQSIIRAEKNKAATAALRFINQFDPQGESIAKVYWSEDPDQLGDITKAPPVYKRTLDKDGKVVNQKVNAFQMKDDVLAAKVGGKTYYMQFADPKVGLALKKMTFGELGVAMKMVRFVSGWQSLINTRANPAFVPINMLRDIQTGATIALSKDFKAGEIARMVGSIPSAWGALWRDARGKPGQGKWDKVVADFKANGGKISFDQYNSIEGTAKKIKKDLERAGKQGVAGKTWRGFVDLVENLNDTIENGMRVAVYQASIEQGKTPKRAAFLARDLTVDFQKKGEITPHMNALYTFFNASVQGNTNFAKALYKSRKVKVAMGALVMAGYAQHVINAALAGDDDDGENAYLKMLRNQPWEFERNIVIFLPGSKEYIKLPLGFGMNAFWHFGVQAGAVTTGDKGFLDATLDSTRVAFDAFNPLGSGGWISMVLPSVIDPIWELGTNQDFSGKPIYPQENQYDPAPPPKSEQSFKATAPVFRWGAETLNKISGGNEILPGKVDVYPDSIEYLWGWFSGGIGRFASQTVQTAQRGVDLEFEPKKTPFVRSFYGEVDDAGKRAEYFSQREKVQFVKGKAKEFSEAGDEEGLERFIKENQQDYDAISAFDATEKQRRKLNKQRRRIESQDPPDAKSMLDEVEKQELELMNEARKVYYELRSKP